MGRYGSIIFIVYLLFGLYFLNYKLVFLKLPDLTKANPWIILIGGILIIIGGINYLRASRRSYRRRR